MGAMCRTEDALLLVGSPAASAQVSLTSVSKLLSIDRRVGWPVSASVLLVTQAACSTVLPRLHTANSQYLQPLIGPPAVLLITYSSIVDYVRDADVLISSLFLTARRADLLWSFLCSA